jgi:hypothetical protein
MRGRLIAVAAILVLALPGLLLAKGIDLYTLFPNLTLGSDPGAVDYVYVSCAGITANTLTLQVHVVTDAPINPDDYLQGIDVELEASADQGGVTLDTTTATVYNGSAVQVWGDSLVSVNVTTNGGNPSVFPLKVQLGAVELHSSPTYLGPGDHIFATLKFNLSSPTNINVAGTCISNCPATLVTSVANGYTVQVTEKTCGPAVPTLSEWGLILFGVILFGSLVWYLRRRPVTAAA